MYIDKLLICVRTSVFVASCAGSGRANSNGVCVVTEFVDVEVEIYADAEDDRERSK